MTDFKSERSKIFADGNFEKVFLLNKDADTTLQSEAAFLDGFFVGMRPKMISKSFHYSDSIVATDYLFNDSSLNAVYYLIYRLHPIDQNLSIQKNYDTLSEQLFYFTNNTLYEKTLNGKAQFTRNNGMINFTEEANRYCTLLNRARKKNFD